MLEDAGTGKAVRTEGMIAGSRALCALWAFGFALLTMILRAPFARLPFGQQDEGYYAAVARATEASSRLYADIGYVRPPGLNTVYLFAYEVAALFGERYDLTVRLLAALVAAAAVAVLAAFLVRRLDVVSAAVGSLLAALFSASFSLQAEANSETWLMLPYVASALLLLKAMERPSRWQLMMVLGAGGLLGGAALFKEVALVGLALPLIGVIAFGRGSRVRWLALTAALSVGALFVWAIVVALLAASGQAAEFLYHTWVSRLLYVYDTQVATGSLAVLSRQLEFMRWAFVVPFAAGLGIYGLAMSAAVRWRTPAALYLHFAAAWLALSMLGVAVSGRFYQHYFIQATIPLALLIAVGLSMLLRTAAVPSVTRGVACAVALVAVVASVMSFARDVRVIPDVLERRSIWPDLAERVDRQMPAGGRLLMWGTFVSLRAYSDSEPTTDVVWTYYPLGEPGGNRFLGREFPSVGDRLLADITDSPPEMVVLTSPLGHLLPGARGSALDDADDLRVERALIGMLESQFELTAQTTEYAVYERVR